MRLKILAACLFTQVALALAEPALGILTCCDARTVKAPRLTVSLRNRGGRLILSFRNRQGKAGKTIRNRYLAIEPAVGLISEEVLSNIASS